MNAAAPSLLSAVPILNTGKLDETLAFFSRLGFTARYNDGRYAIVRRDSVELHFSAMDGLDPKDNQHECRINVRDIEALYASFPADAVHPNGKLAVQPYGMKEFAVLDPGGLCVKFAERV